MINPSNPLLIANEKLTETNEKFATVNKELAAVNKELAAVNKEVVQLNEQIKQYQEKQNEFINIISHELKTPIHAIIGYIELFFEQPEKKAEYGERIMRNAERLQKMITDLLVMSKIDNDAPGAFTDPGYLAALERVARAADDAGKAAASCCATHPRWDGIATSAIASSASGPTARSSPTAHGPCSGRPAGADRAGRPAAPPQPSTSASSGVAGSGAPLGRGEVWAMMTPRSTRPAPSSWMGASLWSRKTNDSATMKTGSVVLTSAAWAAPMRRAPAYRAWIARNEAISPMPTRYGQAAVGIVSGSSGAPAPTPITAKTAAVAVIITAVVPAASRAAEASGGASVPSRSRRSPDRRADRTIQTE